MHKVLYLLPSATDLVESSKLDKQQYEVHVLHGSDEVPDKDLWISDFQDLLAQPGFLTSYVDKAVNYVRQHGITAIVYSHDLSSVLASVVCEKTGLRGPTLESTFCCLHKYYTRITDRTDMWFDYIHLDQPTANWKNKIHYPCCLKAPALAGSRGLSKIHSDEEMVDALANLKEELVPFFTGYSTLFKKFLDLKKFPLAVENIVLVEDLVVTGTQYQVEGWTDEKGNFTFYSLCESYHSKVQREAILAFIVPQCTLSQSTAVKLINVAKEMNQSLGLRNTFIHYEYWKHGDKFTLIEANCRIVSSLSEGYRRTWGVSGAKAGVQLACGEIEKLRVHVASTKHKDGQPIVGLFLVRTKCEGKAKDLVNFNYAKNGCIMDGVYSNDGPGLTLISEEDSLIQKWSSYSTQSVCFFQLSDTNHTRLVQRAQNIMKKMVLRPEDVELNEFDLNI